MAGKLKDFFNEQVVQGIARDLRRVYPAFDEQGFVKACMKRIDELELIDRGHHVAETLHRFLPQPFAQAARVLVASLGPEHEGTEDFGMAPFRYLGHASYIARFGLADTDVDVALDAQYEITERFSAEFSIRAFIERHPSATFARLRVWASDESPHVRRLVSEGTRPRLPWASRLRALQRDPSPVIALLELLKDDPERYVQRSVANHLNDVAKDHPDIVVDICRRWSVEAPPGRRYIVSHALRSLVKQGHAGALEVLGYGDKPRIKVENVALSSRAVKIGGTLRFSCDVISTSKQAQELLVDYAVHFMKASGTARAKVFKLKKLSLPSKGRVTINASVSFTQMTTRKHHPGRHSLELLVNGAPL